MSEFRVSSRYAKSVLELAIEKGVLEQVKEDMDFLDAVSKSSREFSLTLSSPIVTSDKKEKVLKALFEKKGNPLTLTFFEIITRKNRASLLLDIAREFKKQYNAYKGIQVAELTTTFPINDELRAKFVQAVKDISGLQQVELVEKVNQELIGGFVLKVNDRQLDESLSSKLKNLRLQFSSNHYEKKF